jgi:hypothetical protein
MALFLDDTPTYRYYASIPQRLAASNAELVRKLTGMADEQK